MNEVLWLAAAVGGALMLAMLGLLGLLVSLVRERSERWKS